jgi:hypothetical protein
MPLSGQIKPCSTLVSRPKYPLKPDILAFIPTLPDSILAVNNANLIHQQQVKELRDIKYCLQVITAFTLTSAVASFFYAVKKK